MMKRTRMCAAVVGVALLAGSHALAGPITPPPGPVAGTGKTLTEVEPRVAINAVNTPGDADSVFKVTQPGSYYLAGNVLGASGKHGIEIAASNVTIDMNGFALVGVVGSGSGVAMEGSRTSIAIRNGTVSGWGASGVSVPLASGFQIQGVIASGNGNIGIHGGTAGMVRDCVVRANVGIGIQVGNTVTLEGCASTESQSYGIVVGASCTLTNCSAALNKLIGIQTGDASTVRGCSSIQNDGDGIFIASSSTIADSTAAANKGHGIRAVAGCLIEGNTAAGNETTGIHATYFCTIRGNVLDFNRGTGAGVGIHTTDGLNRIEGNTCTDNGTGIKVVGTRNLITGNTCGGNATAYDIAANNRYGPIVNISGGGAPAVLGSSAADSSGTIHPFTNFTY